MQMREHELSLATHLNNDKPKISPPLTTLTTHIPTSGPTIHK